MTHKQKPRILFCGEASWLSTGFATYNREIMKRLHKTGKYEIAEMGSYAKQNDPKIRELPWKFYGVLPMNPKEEEIYKGNHYNQFGMYKLDSVLADFQPDIVFDGRDPWMVQHHMKSKFRDFFKLVLVPTVDSDPQKRDWVDNIFRKADTVCTYSKYGKRILQVDGVKVADVLSPGVDLEVFRPLDKMQTRDKWCINRSLFIFGTVMRNQKRKLFPDLFEAYEAFRSRYASRQLVHKAKEKAKAGRTLSQKEKDALLVDHSVLLCHTSFPDLGWDIPELIRRSSLQRHAIFTYVCENCNESFLSWFIACNQKGIARCVVCGQQSAHMPNTHKGVDIEELVEIFNLIDVYVQPAICEGWGVPIVEAKACGTPGLYSNYSAMEDHVSYGGGYGIKLRSLYTEAETMAKRSLPDISDMVRLFYKLIKDRGKLEELSNKARLVAEKHHNWDITSTKLEKIIDEMELLDRSSTWDSPPRIRYITNERPDPAFDDRQFIVWCYLNILGRQPDQKGFEDWLNSLANGTPREKIEGYFRNQANGKNTFEQIRIDNSRKIRGIPEPVIPQTKTNSIPGVIV